VPCLIGASPCTPLISVKAVAKPNVRANDHGEVVAEGTLGDLGRQAIEVHLVV
jgi:hypothetical protein